MILSPIASSADSLRSGSPAGADRTGAGTTGPGAAGAGAAGAS